MYRHIILAAIYITSSSSPSSAATSAAASSSLAVLLEELEVELLEIAEHHVDLVLLREYRCAEVVGAWPLAETGTRDHADAGRLEELERVEDVRLLTRGLGRLYRLLRHVDARKYVHRTHSWIRLQFTEFKCSDIGKSMFHVRMKKRHNIILTW